MEPKTRSGCAVRNSHMRLTRGIIRQLILEKISDISQDLSAVASSISDTGGVGRTLRDSPFLWVTEEGDDLRSLGMRYLDRESLSDDQVNLLMINHNGKRQSLERSGFDPGMLSLIHKTISSIDEVLDTGKVILAPVIRI